MRTPRKNSRGYTVVEVLSAMTLFAIGAAGVISMQRVTIQGGNDARHFDVASNIAQEWTFRLQRDAMFWTLPDADNPTVSNLLTATRWIKDVQGATQWMTPPVPGAGSENGFSPAFDLFGRDRPTGSADHVFCTQYRLAWIANPNVTPLGSFLRAEVRVVWARLETANIDGCDAFAASPDPDATRYHFVYATTVIRGNPAQ